jgi:small subunit ribosomal protein S7
MRKAKPKKRIILPDPKFNDTSVTRFVNNMMVDGKKSIAYDIFYNAVELVEKKTNENGLEVWKKALNNVMPAVEVKSRRVGGANFQVPTEVRAERKIALGMKWQAKLSRLLKARVQQSRRKKTHTKWQRLTKHSLILDSNNCS